MQAQRVPNPDPSLELLRRIVELGVDVDANETDARFAQRGGKIFYVFDENIFEIFVQPSERASQVNSLYSQELHPRRKDYEASFEYQSALITSEFLLSSDLPGAKGNYIYVTKPHRDELLLRMTALTSELEQALRGNEDQAIKEFAMKIDSVLEVPRGNIKRWEASGPLGEELKRDLDALLTSGADEKSLHRFFVARKAAATLAEAQHVEPLEQVERIFTAPMFRRIRAVHLDFQPTDDDRREISRETRMWRSNLDQEQQLLARLRAGGSIEDFARSERALQNDAESLAFLRWAASRRTYPNQRIVLVTGDKLLFSAYRRWYSHLSPESREFRESFILRRPSQFLPIFNLSASDNDISRYLTDQEKPKEIFARLLSLITMALIPVKLFEYSSESSWRHLEPVRRSHRLAQVLSRVGTPEDEDILHDLQSKIDNEWRNTTAKQSEDILSSLRTLERISIGTFLSYIMMRTNEEHRKIAGKLRSSNPTKAAAIIQEHMSSIIERVRANSARAWPHLAEEFLQRLQPPVQNQRRIPLTIWYRLSDGGTLADLVEQWLSKSSSVKWHELVTQSNAREAPFVIAATLALFSNEWFEAERFATVAVEEYTADHRFDRRKSDNYFELLFLSAVTKRFRLANVDTHVEDTIKDASDETVIRTVRLMGELLDGAIRILDTCLQRPQEDKFDERDECLLWKLRILSERGSLRTFAAASLTPDPASAFFDERAERAACQLRLARQDLEQCLAVAGEIADTRTAARRLSLLERQFVPVLISTEILHALSTPIEHYTFDEKYRVYKKQARDYLRLYENSSFALVRAQLLAYLILLDPKDGDAHKQLRQVCSQYRAQALTLDRWLLARIQARFVPEG